MNGETRAAIHPLTALDFQQLLGRRWLAKAIPPNTIFEDESSRLKDALKLCRSVVADYRAMLKESSDAPLERHGKRRDGRGFSRPRLTSAVRNRLSLFHETLPRCRGCADRGGLVRGGGEPMRRLWVGVIAVLGTRRDRRRGPLVEEQPVA